MRNKEEKVKFSRNQWDMLPSPLLPGRPSESLLSFNATGKAVHSESVLISGNRTAVYDPFLRESLLVCSTSLHADPLWSKRHLKIATRLEH